MDTIHPALLAMQSLGDDRRRVIIGWPDGDRALVRLDNYIHADESDDEVGAWIVDIEKALSHRPSSARRLEDGGIWEIRADDPPSQVTSPDGLKRWPS